MDPPLHLDGAWQMAIDEWLLDQAVERECGGAALRFYRWCRPTLSLGFHQRRIEPRWWSLAAAGVIDLVRRPTGGRAVLHGGDLTYALVWPTPPSGRREAYARACVWLQEAFSHLGLPLGFGGEAPGGGGSGNCFATATRADLVHENGAKRVGSAQLWRRGRLLQHGSILLDPPCRLWRELFGVDPPPLPPLPLPGDALLELLRHSAAQHFPGLEPLSCQEPGDSLLTQTPLTRSEWRAIGLRRDRYLPPLPSGRETSPEVTMERATWPRAMPRG